MLVRKYFRIFQTVFRIFYETFAVVRKELNNLFGFIVIFFTDGQWLRQISVFFSLSEELKGKEN